jgi:hypothetical protein
MTLLKDVGGGLIKTSVSEYVLALFLECDSLLFIF